MAHRLDQRGATDDVMDWHLKQKSGVNEGYTVLRLMGVLIYQSVVSR